MVRDVKRTITTKTNQLQLNDFGSNSLLEGTVPHLEFEIEFQSNNLTSHQTYNKRQIIIIRLIKTLQNEGLGYRRISHKLNSWGIKTDRGNTWFPQSVHSVLKRWNQMIDRVDNQRKREFDTHISKFELKYYYFD